MGFIILVLLIATLLGLLIGCGILLGISRLFNVQNSNYRKSFVILIASGVACIVAGAIFSIIDLGFLSTILASLTTFLAFHYFFKKYYFTAWWKSLGIYVVFGIVGTIVAIILILPIRLFIVEPFMVVGDAMSPTYREGDYLLVNKLDKTFERGDVVMVDSPEGTGQILIRRIIGLPGERIEIHEGVVYVNGAILNENYISDTLSNEVSVELDGDSYFVMSDNRNLVSPKFPVASAWQANTSNILGKVFYKLPNFAK